MNFETASIFTTLAGTGMLAAGLGFAYSQVKIGSVKAKDELIATLKDTAVVEREKATRLAEEKSVLTQSHQEQINSLSKELGKLQGLLQANEVKLKEYIELIQGRDPELREVLQDIRNFMKRIAEQSDRNEVRNKEIDVNTSEDSGNLMRGRKKEGSK